MFKKHIYLLSLKIKKKQSTITMCFFLCSLPAAACSHSNHHCLHYIISICYIQSNLLMYFNFFCFLSFPLTYFESLYKLIISVPKYVLKVCLLCCDVVMLIHKLAFFLSLLLLSSSFISCFTNPFNSLQFPVKPHFKQSFLFITTYQTTIIVDNAYLLKNGASHM